ncbi:MAG: ComEC/Rec2 family competence protein, partial [Candidatus Nitrotoga sp.]
MRYAVLVFAFGVWLLQQQAILPNPAWGGITLLLAAALMLPRSHHFQRKAYPALLVAFSCTFGFFYAAFFAQQRLSDTLPAEWEGKDIQIIGVVGKLPQQHEYGLRFVFDVEQVLTPNAIVPSHILLASYYGSKVKPLDIHAGERWQLTVRLKQPHGSSNPHDFDFEAWMLENKLRASGYIYRKQDNSRLDALVT